MELMKEKDSRFVNLEKKIGLFVVIAIAGIIVAIFLLGIQQDIFTSKTTIYFIAPSGKNINEGQSVKLSGFKIGKVKKLSLDDIASVKVELSINTKYMKWIKSDSKARRTKEALIGEEIIEITPGSINAKKVEGQGVIDYERVKELSEMAEEIQAEIKPVLTDIKQIISYINDPKGNIKQTLGNIQKLSEDILVTQKHVDTLIQNTDQNLKSTITNVNTLLDSAKTTITNTDNIMKKIDKDIPGIMEKANKTLENVEKTTGEIKKITEQAAPQIPPIIEKGGNIAEGTKDIVDSVKKVWPIRSLIKQPEEKTLKVDSYE